MAAANEEVKASASVKPEGTTPLPLLRVKRRRNEDPVETLQMTAKRLKKDDESKIRFSLAATVEPKDLQQSLKAMTESKVPKKDVKTSSTMTAEKLREKMRAARADVTARKRFKLLKDLRQVDLDNGEVVKLVDVEVIQPPPSKMMCNGIELTKDVDNGGENEDKDDADFVYDVYQALETTFVGETNFDDGFLDRICSIMDADMADFFDYEREDKETYADDDSDSNSESNWRNDYPDEEEYNYYAEDDSDLSGFDDLHIGAGDDEDDEHGGGQADGLVYSRAFQQDANLHGESYARYKQRIQRDLYGEDEDSDVDYGDEVDDLDY